MSRSTSETVRALDAPVTTIPVPRGPVPQEPPEREPRSIEIRIDGRLVSVPEGSTILDAARKLGIDTPTLCFLQSLTPVNACRVCVVELEGSRALVPACSRKVEPNMSIRTDSERVGLSRRLVLEFLASSVDFSTAPAMQVYLERYSADPERFGATRATAHCRRKSTTSFTFATTRSAYCATSAWKPVAWTRKIPLRLLWPAGASPLTLPPSSTYLCPTRPACIVATASASAPQAR